MMRRPDPELIGALLAERLEAGVGSCSEGELHYGRVVDIGIGGLRVALTGVALGELCRLEPSGIEGEIVAIQGGFVSLSPFAEPVGVMTGSLVRPLGRRHRVALGDFLLGSILDGMGRVLDGGMAPRIHESRDLDRAAPDPLARRLINTPLPLGVRAIDGLLTCGQGQRVGIFAAAGGGKSTLLGMICDGCMADVIVLALIGERGREVGEFLHALPESTRERTVVVVATADRPALERLKAAYVATTIAEYFRDQGRHVLLMMDSLTRCVRAAREIGRVVGENAVTGSSGMLSRLLERAGPGVTGSITGLYTVLVEGDNLNEPVADEVRAILDGHIVLSRQLAESGHFPAIDIGASVSRVMFRITDQRHRDLAARLRHLLAINKDIELLVRVGEYQAGHDAEADEALARRMEIRRFLCQGMGEKSPFEHTLRGLAQVVEGAC